MGSRLNNMMTASTGFVIFAVTTAAFVALLLVAWSPSKKEHHEDPTKAATERWMTQPLDHYDLAGSARAETFQQRYFWVPPPKSGSKVVFFYAGNEASVEAYVKSCGIMWENAAQFNAALVFAEHRFWGKSVPRNKRFDVAGPDQAIKDFSRLLQSLFKNETGKHFTSSERVKVVAFGGSYGGMLAAWMRLIHPEIIDAAVASSAPILAFPQQHHHLFKKKGFHHDGGASYWKIVTKVFSRCSEGIHSALASKKLASKEAKAELGICEDVVNAKLTEADILTWIGYPLETLCMADYSFSSTYITGRMLPARPAQLACDRFLGVKGGGLSGVRAAIGVMYNDTGLVRCYHIPDRRDATFYDGMWDQYWCRWMIPQETYFAMKGPPNDMFLPLPFDIEDIKTHCNRTVGAVPDNGKKVNEWFGVDSESDWAKKASRIVFANGGHDPWASGGYFSSVNPTLVPVDVPSGAHHAELMFSREDDPEDIKKARQVTLKHIRSWLGLDSEPSNGQHEEMRSNLGWGPFSLKVAYE